MARTARLTRRFLARRRAVGIVYGSRASQALGSAIASLARADVLPGPFDYRAMIPPVQTALVRRVSGENLWIWYRFDEDAVTLVNVTATPPAPLD